MNGASAAVNRQNHRPHVPGVTSPSSKSAPKAPRNETSVDVRYVTIDFHSMYLSRSSRMSVTSWRT